MSVYQKVIRYLGKSSIVVLICLFLLEILINLSSTHILISYEFYNQIYMFNLVISLIIGFSIFIGFLGTDNQSDPVDIEDPRTWPLGYRIILGLIFTVGMTWFGYVYTMPSIVTFGFHHTAKKEPIEINAEQLRVARAHQKGTYWLRCTYWLEFNKPEISPLSQYVCIDSDQYDYFTFTNLPDTVLLYGQKSEYGYELHCCD